MLEDSRSWHWECGKSPGELIRLCNGHPFAKPSLVITSGGGALHELQFASAQTKYPFIWAHSDSFQGFLRPVAVPNTREGGDGKAASNLSRPPLQGRPKSNSGKAGWIQTSKGWRISVSLSGWALLKIEFPPQQTVPLKPNRSFGGGV